MPSRREMFCAKAFDRYLSNDREGPLPCWEPVAAGKDPPDFYLRLAADTYAVEVTSTQVWRQPIIADTPVLEETFEATHRGIALAVERLASERGLSGRYILSFDQPIASRDFPQTRDKLVAAIADAIEHSQSDPPAWSQDVAIDDVKLCWLFRGGDGPIKVHDTTGDDAWTESPEFLPLVSHMLRRAISEKKRKLKERAIVAPAILLLLNTYLLAEPSHYLAALSSIPDREAFHSLFLVHGDGGGTMLQSRNTTWK